MNMTLDQAVEVCAKWWTHLFRLGIWDNGDRQTEVMNILGRTLSGYALTEDDYTNIKHIIKTWLIDRCIANLKGGEAFRYVGELSFDYGGPQDLDEAIRKYNPKISTLIHGPQKTWSRIEKYGPSGEMLIRCKSGYGKPIRAIDRDGIHTPECNLVKFFFDKERNVYKRWVDYDKVTQADIWEYLSDIKCTCAPEKF